MKAEDYLSQVRIDDHKIERKDGWERRVPHKLSLADLDKTFGAVDNEYASSSPSVVPQLVDIIRKLAKRIEHLEEQRRECPLKAAEAGK
ncbi:hypothetical protein LCGC14_0643440 [marine sediment metagenome]|uniref:Uncharacterized protein n=1 Tax=marine sediment metagenome TaxID=412755 RepID=A0A0F9U6V3_9ZZZZ